VLELLRRHGDWMGQNELTRRTQFLSGRDRKDVLDTLTEGGEVESDDTGGGVGQRGRPGKRYRLRPVAA